MVKTRGWTKWGGGRLMLIKENPDVWYCQACAEKQAKQSPAYMFPLDGENWVRICSECENKVIRVRIVAWTDLKEQNSHGMAVDNT